jgi:TCP-1/cpn60 chaperonin family
MGRYVLPAACALRLCCLLISQGESARMSSFVGAIAIADLVKSTLGPKGMDKILQSASGSGAISVTNDGATILTSIVVDNPAAKVLINISKTQDDEVGDGTTRLDAALSVHVLLWCVGNVHRPFSPVVPVWPCLLVSCCVKLRSWFHNSTSTRWSSRRVRRPKCPFCALVTCIPHTQAGAVRLKWRARP